MRKFTSIIVAMTIVAVSSFTVSAEYHSVTVKLKDNTSVSVNLSDDLTIAFDETQMLVNSSALESEVAIPKSNILSFEHSVEHTGINDVAADAQAPVLNGNSISFTNLPANTHINIYDMAGHLMSSAVATGNHTVPFSSLGQGVYLIKVNNSTYKIAVK